MADFLLLMHNDVERQTTNWDSYLAALRKGGNLQGGSAIGGGVCLRKSGNAAPMTQSVGGYIHIEADDLDHAKRLVAGNPVFEAGGTVEIRELPRTD